MHGRVPVKAAIEGWGQFAWRPGVLIRGKDVVAGLVRIFAVNAGQCELSETVGGGGVQLSEKLHLPTSLTRQAVLSRLRRAENRDRYSFRPLAGRPRCQPGGDAVPCHGPRRR